MFAYTKPIGFSPQLLTRELDSNSAVWSGLDGWGHGHEHITDLPTNALVLDVLDIDHVVLSETDVNMAIKQCAFITTF